MRKYIEEILLGRNKLVFIFQDLGFMVKKGKSYMETGKIMEFLGFIIYSDLMTIYL